MHTTAAEEIGRQELAKMRSVALLLLLLMGAVYFACTKFGGLLPSAVAPALPWIRAFSEAAMVGACADWFAVTALFRRPLGLPIPHTAIVPRNKARIGATLGEFVRANFLTDGVIRSKLRTSKPSAQLAAWLSEPEHRREVSSFVFGAVNEGLVGADDGALQRLFTEVLRDTFQRADFASAAARILDLLISEQKHSALFNSILKVLERAVETHHTFIRAKVREGMPWWVPGFVHDRVYDVVIGKFKDTLQEVNADPNHILRLKINEALTIFVDRLSHDEQLRSEIAKFKEWLLTHPIAADYSAELFSDLKVRLLVDIKDANSRTRNTADEILGSLAIHLAKDLDVQRRIDAVLEQTLTWGAARYGHQITNLISETVQSWDTQTLVQKIELEVGKDLQFIRINGTIVGGLVGLLLHAITVALGV